VLTPFQIILWGLVALPVLVAVVVLIGFSYGQYSLRQSIRFASSSPCPNCRRVVGRAAVLAAKDRYSQKVQEMQAQHPGVKFRLRAEWEIQCPHCGSTFYFTPDGSRITTTSSFGNN
jgi:hypothetical protein